MKHNKRSSGKHNMISQVAFALRGDDSLRKMRKDARRMRALPF